MGTEKDRRIDWEVVALNGGLFPLGTQHDLSPLIDLTAPSAAADSAPSIPDQVSARCAPSAPPRAAPRRYRRLTAAGLAGGLLFTSVCAMAFQGGIAISAWTTAASR